MPDDFKANPRTKGTVAVGGSASGVIEKARDVDWFAVELVAGRTYVIDLEGSDAGGGTLTHAMLHGLFDGDGSRVARREHNGAEGGSARMTYTATEDGTHYIAAKGYRKEHTGTYTVRVSEQDADARAAGAADLGDLGARVLRHDSVDGGGDATDYYRFTLNETQAVTLILRDQDADADLYLEDGDGAVLHSSTRDGTRREKIEATLAAGTYYVRVAAEETGDNAYTLRAGARDLETTSPSVSVSEPEGEDFPANTSTAGRVLVGDSVTGNIERRNDVDWFAVVLEKGVKYRIDLKAQKTGDGTLKYPHFYGVYDGDGNYIPNTSGERHSLDALSKAWITPTESGTYYVAAKAFQPPRTHTDTGTYTLRVMAEDADAAAAGAIDLGDIAAMDGGRVHRDSVDGRADVTDYYRFNLSKARKVKFDLQRQDADADLFLEHEYGIVRYSSEKDGVAREKIAETLHPGTYYVRVEAQQVGKNAYNLRYSTDDLPSVSEPRGVDFNEGTTGNIGRVKVGDSATGRWRYDHRNRMGDWDLFAVDMEQGKTYRIDLKGEGSGYGTLDDPEIEGIYNEYDERLPNTRGDDTPEGTSDARVFFAAPETATFYVLATGFDWDDLGTYRLFVDEYPDDFAADTGTTGRVSVNGWAAGEITLWNDRDWFAVELEAGKTYQVEMKGSRTDDGTMVDTNLRGIHDANGNFIPGTANDNAYVTHNYGRIYNSRVFFTPTESGTYYVAAGAGDHNWRYLNEYHFGTYKVRVIDTSTDDFAASTATAGAVAVGGGATGRVETPDDRDWFAVDLKAGRFYRFDLAAAANGENPLRDPALHGIYDSAGNLIAGTTNADGGEGNDSLVLFTPAASGTHYVAAGADGVSPDVASNYYGRAGPGSKNPNAAANYFGPGGPEVVKMDNLGAYALSVAEVPDDHGADTATTGRVAAGGSGTGEIEAPGDVDWFAVTLEAGKIYRFVLKGAPGEAGTLEEPALRGVYDAEGALIAGTTSVDASGEAVRVWFRPDASATYYVATGAVGAEQGDVGTYTLSLEAYPEDDHGADTATAGALVAGAAASGEIGHPGDRDWFAVTLKGNKLYRIDLKGAPTGDGTLADPYLHGIHNSRGKFLDWSWYFARGDSMGNHQLVYGTAPTNDDGGLGENSRLYFQTSYWEQTYYVAVGGDGDHVGTYSLTVEAYEDGM